MSLFNAGGDFIQKGIKGFGESMKTGAKGNAKTQEIASQIQGIASQLSGFADPFGLTQGQTDVSGLISLNPPIGTIGGIVQEGITQIGESLHQKLSAESKKVQSKRELIGALGVVLHEKTIKSDLTTPVIDGLTREVLDTTSYNDRILIRLKDDLGYDCYLTKLSILGKPIFRTAGEFGGIYSDSLKRADDIRKNGENKLLIQNDYIFSATQVMKIADYWFKRCGEKKHIYICVIPGCAVYYEPGDWYTFALGEARINEYIDVKCEVVKVECQRDAGGIGSTTLVLRECMENWAKTTSNTARYVSGASPKRRKNQANTLIVASSTSIETANYYCDGTADDVQIQAAIDRLYYTEGGGVVKITTGDFYLADAATITLRPNVSLIGDGPNTIIHATTDTVNYCIACSSASDICAASDFKIIAITSGIDASSNMRIANVIITVASGNGTIGINGTAANTMSISDCRIDTFLSGIYNCGQLRNNYVTNCLAGYEYCGKVTNNIADLCTSGFVACTSMQQNKATTCTSPYTTCYADAGSSNAVADTAAGGYNS